MKLIIDTKNKTLQQQTDTLGTKEIDLYSKEAFDLVSQKWIELGWNQKYTYTFTWCGRPIIQLPEDMIRLQEVIYQLQPDVIIETGVAHGGSLIYSASLCKVIGKGRVIGVDIEIRPHNRKAIEEHPLSSYITLVEGDSVAPDIIDEVKRGIAPGETVLVILDSNHTKEHVLKELQAYHHFVTLGSYIVATDGVMEWVAGVPRGDSSWADCNPMRAAEEFLTTTDAFVEETPTWAFNEGTHTTEVTHWPKAWLKRIK